MKKFLILVMLALAVIPNTSPLSAEWDEYYNGTIGITEPRQTLKVCESLFETPGLAVDLGAGTGRDTLYLLRKGWRVIALDYELLALEIITNRAHNEGLCQFEVQLNTFKDMVLPENVDLINASFSLPFCDPQDFPECWKNIIDHLAIGGRFSGQFFGDQDEWVSNSPEMTFLTEEQIKNLFKDNFEIEYIEVQKGLIPTSQSPNKNWHLVHIVAKKVIH